MSHDRPFSVRQLPLSLPHRAAMTRGDFLVGAANSLAIQVVDSWPDWPTPSMLLSGPAGSGKTHLVEIWCEASGASVVNAASLGSDAVEEVLAAGAAALEDLHAGPLDEAAIFHFLNLATERKTPLLLTSRVGATLLPLRLPDLVSRLRAIRPVELGAPDDDLLRRVLVKLFADRQLAVDGAVVDYLMVRMERSLQAANTLVEDLDRVALARGVPITRRLAAETLGGMADSGGDGD